MRTELAPHIISGSVGAKTDLEFLPSTESVEAKIDLVFLPPVTKTDLGLPQIKTDLDFLQVYLQNKIWSSPLMLLLLMVTPVSTDSSTPFHTPIKNWDIYLDNYCDVVQVNKWQGRTVKRILFQALDKVFRPLNNDDTPFCQEPVSIKKLKKGDAH